NIESCFAADADNPAITVGLSTATSEYTPARYSGHHLHNKTSVRSIADCGHIPEPDRLRHRVCLDSPANVQHRPASGNDGHGTWPSHPSDRHDDDGNDSGSYYNAFAYQFRLDRTDSVQRAHDTWPGIKSLVNQTVSRSNSLESDVACQKWTRIFSKFLLQNAVPRYRKTASCPAHPSINRKYRRFHAAANAENPNLSPDGVIWSRPDPDLLRADPDQTDARLI